jgi:uncharacterized protein (DUF302 family)
MASGSKFGPKETMDWLAAAETIRGISIMDLIDHAAAAAVISMEFRPTEVLIFGNPRAATLLMQAAQTVGIDFPLKALVGGRTEMERPALPTTIPRWPIVTVSMPG